MLHNVQTVLKKNKQIKILAFLFYICLEYYNLCNPPPDREPLPTLPRRKPYITSPDLTHSSSSIIGQSANLCSSNIGQQTNPSSSIIGQQNRVTGTHRVHPGTHRGHETERNRGIPRERQGTMKEELEHHSLPSFTSTLGIKIIYKIMLTAPLNH